MLSIAINRAEHACATVNVKHNCMHMFNHKIVINIMLCLLYRIGYMSSRPVTTCEIGLWHRVVEIQKETDPSYDIIAIAMGNSHGPGNLTMHDSPAIQGVMHSQVPWQPRPHPLPPPHPHTQTHMRAHPTSMLQILVISYARACDIITIYP